jgi:hypothetical protein
MKLQQQESDFAARAGFMESMQIENNAAVEEEKSKLQVIMSKNEVNLKVYYEEKVVKLEKDLEELKLLLAARMEENLRLQKRLRSTEDKL